MACPFEKKQSSLSLPSVDSERGQHRAPIEAIVSDIFASVFRLPDFDVTPYCNKLKDNFIVDTFVLSRLKVGALDKLQLPIGLESELKRYIQAENQAMAQMVPVAAGGHNSRDRSVSPTRGSRRAKRSRTPTPAGNSSILGLTPDSIRLIKESWKLITAREAMEDGTSRLAKFFNDFYATFMEKDPLGRKLFEGASMQNQAQALMRMMKFIIAGLDNPVQLVRPLQKLGVRHLIYGVEMKNFQMFGVALAQTFENVLGKQVCTSAMKEAWYLLTQALAEIMTKEYSAIKEGFFGPLYHRNNRNKWVLVEAYINHEKLVVYADSTRKKIKNEWMLSHVDSLEIVEDHQRLQAPNQWCFAISLESTVSFYFCSTSEEDLLDWTSDLTERIQAFQRVGRFVHTDSSSGDDDNSSDGGGAAVDAKARAKRKASKLKEGLSKARAAK